MTVLNGGSIGAGGSGNLTEHGQYGLGRLVYDAKPAFAPLRRRPDLDRPGDRVLDRAPRAAGPSRPMIELDDVRRAAARLDGVAHRTPALSSRTLDERVGARVYLKAENLQRVGAFKFRGAYNAIASLSAGERERGVAAVSSGNHAQAVALAARLLGTKATILMPEDAPAEQAAPPRAATAPR